MATFFSCELPGCYRVFEADSHRRFHLKGCFRRTPSQRATKKTRLSTAKYSQFSVAETESGAKQYSCQFEGCSVICSRRVSLANHMKRCALKSVLQRQQHKFRGYKAPSLEEVQAATILLSLGVTQ